MQKKIKEKKIQKNLGSNILKLAMPQMEEALFPNEHLEGNPFLIWTVLPHWDVGSYLVIKLIQRYMCYRRTHFWVVLYINSSPDRDIKMNKVLKCYAINIDSKIKVGIYFDPTNYYLWPLVT